MERSCGRDFGYSRYKLTTSSGQHAQSARGGVLGLHIIVVKGWGRARLGCAGLGLASFCYYKTIGFALWSCAFLPNPALVGGQNRIVAQRQ